MAKKKSAAQIRRMQMRAENRGEENVPPAVPAEEKTENRSQQAESLFILIDKIFSGG